MTWDDAAALALSLPGAAPGSSYGMPAVKAGGKLLLRLREDRETVVLLETPFDEREVLLDAAPEVFLVTAHYRDHEIVLARLSALDRARLRPFLERRWRQIARKRDLAAWRGWD